MTSYINLRAFTKCNNFTTLTMTGNLFQECNFRKVTNLRVLHFVHLRFFIAGHLRSGQSGDLPHYKIMGNTEIYHFAT